MNRATRTSRPAPSTSSTVGRITDTDILAVRKERDRHAQFGVSWQSWQRILDVLEDAKLAQDEIERASTDLVDDARAAARLQDWLAAGGTV